MEAPEIVFLQIEIPNPRGLAVLVVGDLVVTFVQRRDPAELVLRILIEKQRKKSAGAARLIVDDLRNRCTQAQLRTISVDARIVCEALR